MTQPLEIVNPENSQTQIEVYKPNEMSLSTAPQIVLNEAITAANALKGVLEKKEKKIIFNEKQYLEFEDWQMIARFYGATVESVESKYIELGDVQGFEAKAIVLRGGLKISAADAMCLNDEENWSFRKGKPVPLFQLRSMAQTRACAKALRNVFSHVVVLAGFAATPAEEMQSIIEESRGAVGRKPKTASVQDAPKPKDSKPYWASEFNGKTYLFAKVGDTYNEEFLIKAGMRPSKKNPEIYTGIHSENLEEGLSLKHEFSRDNQPAPEIVDAEFSMAGGE